MGENSVCAIVGAGEGLGVSLARVFATDGMQVALLSRTEAGSAAALEAARVAGPKGQHRFEAADATNGASLEAGLSRVASNLGPVNVLIYNVRGSPTYKPPLEVSAEELRGILDLEVVGALLAAKAVMPGMIERGHGTVIYSSATAAFRGSGRNLSYAAAKFGLRGVAQSLAKAYASKGVHIAHVRLDCALDVPVVRKLMGDRYSPERVANPDDVAKSYLWIHQQPRSAWSNEVELRPLTEDWTYERPLLHGLPRRLAMNVPPLPTYFEKYPNLAFQRDADAGILEVRMHTNGGPCIFNGRFQSDLVDALHDINRDRDNRVIIWTGTGDVWMGGPDFASFGDVSDPNLWDRVYTNERRLLINMLEIDVPMVSAVNGPAILHSELILTMDIVLASETACFQDYPHLTFGIVPGDGMQILWTEALGSSRGRYFLWMQEKLSASEAKALGVVHEIHRSENLDARAWEVARHLAKQPTLNLRYTRQALTQRLKRLVHEGIGYGLALEGLTAADLARRANG